ncbi:MAG: hypothetical protein JSU71_00825, partial [Betaproteobacteria bacterium]
PERFAEKNARQPANNPFSLGGGPQVLPAGLVAKKAKNANSPETLPPEHQKAGPRMCREPSIALFLVSTHPNCESEKVIHSDYYRHIFRTLGA